jgi:hypothetical protein
MPVAQPAPPLTNEHDQSASERTPQPKRQREFARRAEIMRHVRRLCALGVTSAEIQTMTQHR